MRQHRSSNTFDEGGGNPVLGLDSFWLLLLLHLVLNERFVRVVTSPVQSGDDVSLESDSRRGGS